NPDQLEYHLAMPPLKGSPTGPVPSPVPTGVELPNGKMQPFIHVNFYGNAKLHGNQFYPSSLVAGQPLGVGKPPTPRVF
ncbi:MAG: hypothetical protein ACC631_09570, partial [Halocynthiibacter sp.]